MEREAIESEYRGIIEEYESFLKKHFGFRLYSVCLFGSVARGYSSADSDIDVLVVADGIPEDVGRSENKRDKLYTWKIEMLEYIPFSASLR